MSKDDMETATMNVLFDGSEDKDDTDDIDFEDKLDKTLKDYEDDYNKYCWLKRHNGGR